jgi:hypothetical protein
MCFAHNFKDLAFLLAFSRLLLNNRSTTTAGQAINFGRSIAFSADYGRQVKGDKTSLFVEFRFVAGLANAVQSTNLQSIVPPANDLRCAFAACEIRLRRRDFSLAFPRIWLRHPARQRVFLEIRNRSRCQSTGAALSASWSQSLYSRRG